MGEKPIIRSSILGRGTTCWAAKNERGERFVVKDYWVAEGQTSSECKLLEDVKGLKGVCQMVSYEDNRGQTVDFRGDVSTFEGSVFRNRTSVRIVMKAYGRSLENFTSMEQVLGALRDAIAGEPPHQAISNYWILIPAKRIELYFQGTSFTVIFRPTTFFSARMPRRKA
jgi:hypothetical protein